ncbi:MAG TPA: hypothetical protein VEK34_12280 [Methylocella sp.]|nr:hypothetical protein [Methylocella sp.]
MQPLRMITPGSYDTVLRHWKPLAPYHKRGAFEILNRNYSESSRAYHSWDHIAGLLQKLDLFSALASRIEIIALAIFWHDAVYATRTPAGSHRQDFANVNDSAALFREYTLLPQDDADAVHALIMATANHLHGEAGKSYYIGFAGDLDLFLDLDLSSLAAPWHEFIEDFERIRFELSWLPEADFCSKQIQLLGTFAGSEAPLYRRGETRERWEAPARANLERCIGGLEKKLVELSPRAATG